MLAHFQLPVVSMETFGAHPLPSIDVCRRKLEECELVILIVGHRYGSIADSSSRKKVSFTEREFDFARDFSKPIHAYLRRDDVRVIPEFVEVENSKRLVQFRQKVLDTLELTPSYFKSPMDLAIKVAADVSRFLHSDDAANADLKKIARQVRGKTTGGSPQVAICRLFGNPWPRLEESLRKAGWEFVLIDHVDGIEAALQSAPTVIVPGSGFRREARGTDASAIKKLTTYVEQGGRLLCAGQAWSWVEPKYGDKPLLEFPLNKLGAKLGFKVTERYASAPDDATIHEELRRREITSVRRDGRWTASEVEGLLPESVVLLRDRRLRPIVLEVQHEKGKTIVVGRETMLEQNPRLLVALLQILQTGEHAKSS